MSDFRNRLLSSDTDAFKNSGSITEESVTFTGTADSGERVTETTGIIPITNPDYFQVLFDNSYYHSGKFRNMANEGGETSIFETTNNSDLPVDITTVVTADGVELRATVFNLYAGTITFSDMTINFRLITYEATI